MSIKIGLISDVHATPEPLREALAIFREHNVATVLCAGDIAGYGTELEETVELLIKSECEIILGNHDVWFLNNPVNKDKKRLISFFRKLPFVREFTVEKKRLYMVHGSPLRPLGKGVRLLDKDGKILLNQKEHWSRYLEKFESDVLIVGHTHQVFAEKLANTMVINPGSTTYNHTCTVLSLPEMELQILPLSNKVPLMSWNWGMERHNA
ncbi:MAG: metallophosphoesterase family protein [Thermodesulfobacteriota bacterium]